MSIEGKIVFSMVGIIGIILILLYIFCVEKDKKNSFVNFINESKDFIKEEENLKDNETFTNDKERNQKQLRLIYNQISTLYDLEIDKKEQINRFYCKYHITYKIIENLKQIYDNNNFHYILKTEMLENISFDTQSFYNIEKESREKGFIQKFTYRGLDGYMITAYGEECLKEYYKLQEI